MQFDRMLAEQPEHVVLSIESLALPPGSPGGASGYHQARARSLAMD
jgi:hypothetical protein